MMGRYFIIQDFVLLEKLSELIQSKCRASFFFYLFICLFIYLTNVLLHPVYQMLHIISQMCGVLENLSRNQEIYT